MRSTSLPKTLFWQPMTGDNSNQLWTLRETAGGHHTASQQPISPKVDNIMLAFLVLVLAALSRLLPHAMHWTGLNFTAVGAGLLFFGSRAPRWQAIIAAAVMALTDVYLTTAVYHYPFHVRSYITTWIWYAAVCLIGSALLRKVTVLRVIAGVLTSAIGFYIWSDFFVWALGHMYPHTLAGLTACYIAALPFLKFDLASTGIFAAVFFGLPVMVARAAEAMHAPQKSNQTLS